MTENTQKKNGGTTSIKVPDALIEEFKDEQYRARKQGLPEPTYAELIVNAWDSRRISEYSGPLEKHIGEILTTTVRTGDKLGKSLGVVTEKDEEFITEWNMATDALARIMRSGDRLVINAILSNLAVFSRTVGTAKVADHERGGDAIPAADSASLDERVKEINIATEQAARKSGGIVGDIKGERDDARRDKRGNKDDRGKTGSGGGD